MLRRLVVTAGTAVAASLLIAGSAVAQTGVLSGTVLSAGGRAGLEGATVTIVGTTLSAVTDSTGRFTIANVPAGDVELRVRRVQFFPLADRVRVAAGDTTRATYQLLSPDDERAETGRVMVRSPRLSVSDADTAAGFPLAEARLIAKPLIIVDGVIMFDGDAYVRDIDPKGVESIEVIKGELAKEKYGPRATDGVIMIRTKPAVTPPPSPPAPPPPPHR